MIRYWVQANGFPGPTEGIKAINCLNCKEESLTAFAALWAFKPVQVSRGLGSGSHEGPWGLSLFCPNESHMRVVLAIKSRASSIV